MGPFELNDLPEGEWVIFAEPPFDSESFRSFRESGELLYRSSMMRIMREIII